MTLSEFQTAIIGYCPECREPISWDEDKERYVFKCECRSIIEQDE